MSAENVEKYLAEVDRIRHAYGDRCRFYASMEVDYLGPDFGPTHWSITGLPLDYVIGSVHFIPNQHGEPVDIDGSYESFRRKLRDCFNDDIEYVVRTFYRQSLDMVAAGGFDIIGHLDKVGHNASHFRADIESLPWYRELVEQLIHAIADYNAHHPRRPITVEINTKAAELHRGRLFPSPEWWPLLRNLHLPLIVNSDAHYPALIDASRPSTLALLATTI